MSHLTTVLQTSRSFTQARCEDCDNIRSAVSQTSRISLASLKQKCEICDPQFFTCTTMNFTDFTFGTMTKREICDALIALKNHIVANFTAFTLVAVTEV